MARPAGLEPAAPCLDRWARETEREIERGAWRSTGVTERLTVSALTTTAIELAVETAMRREELCSLTWADVDLNCRGNDVPPKLSSTGV